MGTTSIRPGLLGSRMRLMGVSRPCQETFTLSTYCFEHERLIRAEVECERAQATAAHDEPVARELAVATQSV